jgi:hypothetical protein
MKPRIERLKAWVCQIIFASMVVTLLLALIAPPATLPDVKVAMIGNSMMYVLCVAFFLLSLLLSQLFFLLCTTPMPQSIDLFAPYVHIFSLSKTQQSKHHQSKNKTQVLQRLAAFFRGVE